MRTLVLMRHAKSSWEGNLADEQRPLAKRGEKDSEAAGAYLLSKGLAPDVVLVSPALRAQETWQGVQRAGISSSDVRTTDVIYSGDAREMGAEIAELPDSAQTVLVIGHAPTMADLIEFSALREKSSPWRHYDVKYPTNATAVIELAGPWSSLGVDGGTLVDFTAPRG